MQVISVTFSPEISSCDYLSSFFSRNDDTAVGTRNRTHQVMLCSTCNELGFHFALPVDTSVDTSVEDSIE